MRDFTPKARACWSVYSSIVEVQGTDKPQVPPPSIRYYLGERSRGKGRLAKRLSNYTRETKYYLKKEFK